MVCGALAVGTDRSNAVDGLTPLERPMPTTAPTAHRAVSAAMYTNHTPAATVIFREGRDEV